jgi:hypothetical protein
MRIVLAALLLAHGVAHLPGFLVNWQLRSFPEMPYRRTILGGAVDIGDGGIKAIGLVWLVLSMLFVVAAGATLMRATWSLPFVYIAVGLSTALCVLGWPNARLGLAANAVILLLLVIGVRAGWL